MATVKVFSSLGVKELHCFDKLDDVDYISDDPEDVITDDGELTVGTPLE